MNQLPELVLLADEHGLRVRAVLTLIDHASETALDLTRSVELQNAVVEQCGHSLGEVHEAGGDRLLLLDVQVSILVDC